MLQIRKLLLTQDFSWKRLAMVSWLKKLLMGLAGERSRILPQPESATDTSYESKRYRVYAARWLVLTVCCLLALSNSMLWLSFITLTDETREFYCDGSDCSAAFFTNQIFQLVAVITGIGGMYITDSYGIRLSIMCGTTLNFVGSLIRVVSSIPSIDNSAARQALLHTGSVIVASAQAFFLVLPSKIAETWFPDHQRSLANVLTFIANPLGVVLGTIVPSLYFSGTVRLERYSWHMFEFNASMAVMTTITFVLSLFVRQGSPPTPPSASSENHSSDAPTFWKAIGVCFRNKQFVIQLFTFGLAFAELWGFMVIMSDIITEQGYNLYGYPTALAALIGVVASLICGAVADCTKRFKELIRFCWVCFAVLAILIRLWLRHKWKGPFDSAIFLIACAGLGAFSIPQFPIGVEMGVETTFPVYEATSSGLLVLSGQLWMFVMYYVFESAKSFNLFYDFNESSASGNWQLNLDIWCVLAVFAVILSFIANPKYKRMLYEESVREQQQSTDLSRAYELTSDKPFTVKLNGKTNTDIGNGFQITMNENV
ncbi:hypothetical protein Y032_0058g2869 [Ancylostoma ceylanicum]|uniref:Major facilitator superfamily (MFS) profile domain-containing protein n=1 Tax=Ancylostoma ceylanicum TaxID=53326 RepID=A0A016U4V7_9BILA|nr:hypothetical protein Y032_0058g2869 [Ancylostoma ceylanicum]